MTSTHCLLRLRRVLFSLGQLGALLAASLAQAAPGSMSAPVPAKAQTVPTVPTAVNNSAPAPEATPAPSKTPAEALRPYLPLDFSQFATDYEAKSISPPWLVVQVGTLETFYAPPEGKTAFVLPEHDFKNQPQFVENYHPIELTCLMGAKAKFENVTLLNLDKAGNPLGYTLPLGQIVYFVARNETEQGILYSLHYYDSGKGLFWLSNPDKDGAFIPRTEPIYVTQDLGAQAESYAFLYLTQRLGNQRPESTAKPLTLYTYLVIRVHKVPAPAAPTGIVSGR